MNLTTRFRAASAFCIASLLFASCGNLPSEAASETVEAVGEQRQPAPDFSLKDIHNADVKVVGIQRESRLTQLLGHMVRALQDRNALVRRVPTRVQGSRLLCNRGFNG